MEKANQFVAKDKISMSEKIEKTLQQHKNKLEQLTGQINQGGMLIKKMIDDHNKLIAECEKVKAKIEQLEELNDV